MSTVARNVNMQIAKLNAETKKKSSAVKGCENAVDAIQAAMHDMDTVRVCKTVLPARLED